MQEHQLEKVRQSRVFKYQPILVRIQHLFANNFLMFILLLYRILMLIIHSSIMIMKQQSIVIIYFLFVSIYILNYLQISSLHFEQSIMMFKAMQTYRLVLIYYNPHMIEYSLLLHQLINNCLTKYIV